MEEFLDTFDINGKFLEVKSRSYCHSEEANCFHKAVWIWIVNGGGNLLIQKRSALKKKSPNKWDMPSAGHVSAGEGVLETCVRETQEELGIVAKPEDFIFLKEWVNLKGKELAQIYLLKTNYKIDEMTLKKEEVSEVKYLSYDEFVKMFYSEDFCDHAKEYKDWVCETLKELI